MRLTVAVNDVRREEQFSHLVAYAAQIATTQATKRSQERELMKFNSFPLKQLPSQ